MSTRYERISALIGLLAVALWIVGAVLTQALAHPPANDATDAQVLAWIKKESGLVTAGSWIFMLGCCCFAWFAGALRGRLAPAEGDAAPATTIGFAGLVVAAFLGMGFAASDMAAAINSSDVSAGAAGALHQIGTVFFLITELATATALVGLAVGALRSRALPRWWAIVGLVLAVVLVIGPIGWLALLLGLPLWTLLTAGLVLRGPGRKHVPATATAAA